MRDFDGRLSFDPHLPQTWHGLDFSVRFQDRQVRVHLSPTEEHYLVEEGDPLEIVVRGAPRRLVAGEKVVVPLERAAPSLADHGA
jgi:alpha,alpha-trehalose phosphorylase